MAEALPILLTIPHGGDQIPDEIGDQVCLSAIDQFFDSDAYTLDIFNLQDRVAKIVSTPIAPAYLDVNAPQESAIKSETLLQKSIYCSHTLPDDSVRKSMLDNYYKPFHKKIEKAIQNKDIKFAIDCHSMLSSGPNGSESETPKRPLIILNNDSGQSCDYEILERLADCIQVTFNIGDLDLAINQPIETGYIVKKYGNKPTPFVQLLINRSLYLNEPWFDPSNLQIQSEKLKELNQKFHRSLELFAKVVMSKI